MLFGHKINERHECQVINKINGVFYFFSGGFLRGKKSKVNEKNIKITNYTLTVVIQGSGYIINDETNEIFEIHAGQFFQSSPGKSHSLKIENSKEWCEFYVTIPPPLFELISATNELQNKTLVKNIKLNYKLLETFTDYLDTLASVNGQNAYLLLPKICYLITDCLSSSGREKESKILQKAKILLENNHDKKLDLEEFSQENGFSYTNFRKKFKDKFGVSPHQYRIHARMDRAIELLDDLDLPIKVIASQLGYSTQYDFSKHFKKYYSKTPTEYRRNGF